MAQGERCEVLTSFRSNEEHLLSVHVGKPVILLEDITYNMTWVKCRDSYGRSGQVPVNHLDIYKYEEASDPGDDDAESFAESTGKDDGYYDPYVSSDQLLFHCIKEYTGTDISVRQGELVVAIEDKPFKDQRGRMMQLVERRGVEKQKGSVPFTVLEGVHCLEKQRWYLGKETRYNAEGFLKHAFLNKTFLVRISPKTEGFVISIKEDGKYRHRKIKRTATEQYTTIAGAAFNCVVELVYNHLRDSLKGFKLHHEYDKYGKSHLAALSKLRSSFPGAELPPPERAQIR